MAIVKTALRSYDSASSGAGAGGHSGSRTSSNSSSSSSSSSNNSSSSNSSSSNNNRRGAGSGGEGLPRQFDVGVRVLVALEYRVGDIVRVLGDGESYYIT